MRFGQGPKMSLNLTDFNYSLQVASEIQEDVLRYRNDLANDTWMLID